MALGYRIVGLGTLGFFSHARFARDAELSEKNIIVVIIILVFIRFNADF